MTIDEAKRACEEKRTVIYNGAEYCPLGIFSWPKDHGYELGWRNDLYLAPLNGANSSTQALVRDCNLKEPMTVTETA